MKIVIRKKVKKKVPVFLDDILSNACMKQKINFAACWRYFSVQNIKIAFSTTKMAPPGGDIKFVFHRSKRKFPTYNSITCKKHFIKKKVVNFLSYPKSTEISKSIKFLECSQEYSWPVRRSGRHLGPMSKLKKLGQPRSKLTTRSRAYFQMSRMF